MNGARALIETLANCGVELCIANPGTSEMHLVQALDQVPRMRSVLTLFEGVCTGAADGYARMAGKPAATLLHLGPGLANGIANLHNARKAGTPLINIVGNHPQFHIGFDAPLTSDIDTLARNFSSWIKSCSTAETLAQDGADAFTATLRATPGSQGQIATLIMGADAAWSESTGPVMPNPLPRRARVGSEHTAAIAKVMASSAKTVLLLEHDALTAPALEAAGRLAAKTGCRLITGTFPARTDGGPGTVHLERMPYFPEQILLTLNGTEHLILVGAQTPASFFAYQGQSGRPIPEDCTVHTLARIEEDAADALEQLVVLLKAEKSEIKRFAKVDTPRPQGALNTRSISQAVAATLRGCVQAMTGTFMVHVPYRGSGQATADLLSGLGTPWNTLQLGGPLRRHLGADAHRHRLPTACTRVHSALRAQRVTAARNHATEKRVSWPPGPLRLYSKAWVAHGSAR